MRRPDPNTPKRLDADRLFEAAEAAYLASSQIAANNGGRYVRPTDSMDAGEAPACLEPFTRDEIDEATAFLVRMGFLPATTRAA